jgi:serine/threonine protein kinase
MTNLGTTAFVCPQGHRWPIDALPMDRSGDERPRCPICGDAAEPAQLLYRGVEEETPSGSFPRTPAAAPPAGSSCPTVPGYTILGVAGHGRAGVVYKARDLAHHRLVALAVIATERDGRSDADSPSPVDFDLVELRHPNIVRIFATGWYDDGRFLASEFVEGRSLAEFLAGEPLPILAAARLVETLARAVHGAHRHGVYHRDLTLAQIVLTPSQPPRFVDPELGHLCDESGRELVPKITGFGLNGRPSPDGNGGPSVAADVSDLGSILFELLTGHSPRDAQARDRESITPSASNPKVPKDLEAICLACLEADPARRLPDAGLLADALRHFLDSFVTQFPCCRCNKVLKSTKPLRVGMTTVRCPRCGEQSLVKPVGRQAPTPSHPKPAARQVPAPTPRPVPEPRRAPAPATSPTPGGLAASPRTKGSVAPAPDYEPDRGPTEAADRTEGLFPSFPSAGPSWTPSTLSSSQLAGLPVVGGYVLLGELGRGGMGVVYKAKHEKLKRVVALKMIRSDPDEDSQYLARFQAEAEAVARLHHPNIVQIFEVGEQDASTFLALEFVTGGTLKSRLDGRPQPVRAAVQLVQLLARAVHAAHQRGIVHRDLKPSNILLQPAPLTENWNVESGDALEVAQVYGVPKVNDFGLAKRIDDDDEPVRYGDIIGTPLYMAPEQARGRTEEIGPAADIYSLGVILYEMLTGRPPFISESAVDVLRQVLSDPPVPPRQLRQGLSRDLEAICRRCLEKDPRHRYPSALALAEDLGHFLDGDPVRARPPAPLERMWNWSLKNPVPSTLLLTVSAVLAFGQWSLHRLADRMVESTTKESAAQQTELLRVVNSLYTEVATRAKNAGIVVTHKYPEMDGSIPIPAKFTIELGQRMQSLAESDDHGNGLDQSFMQLKLYSEHPFRRRNDSPPKHQFGKDALAFYQDERNKELPFDRIERTRAGARVLRHATPLVMEGRCLKCHNDPKLYEADPFRKTDWKEGDVRGVLEVVCPLEDNTQQTQKTLFETYLRVAGVGATVLTSSWFALRIGRRKRRA